MFLLATFWDTIIQYFSSVPNQWNDFITHFPKYLPIIGVLIVIESLLSVDNAAVLATMVINLPQNQRSKALKYGILGAYLFRGLCLILAGFLVSIWWLKPLGGIYLVFLVYKQFVKSDSDPWLVRILVNPIGRILAKIFRPFNNWTSRKRKALGIFWSTVILVEIMDLAFSIDNVFAAVAFTPNIIAIWFGVFIGILAMRFVAQGFVKLMEKYDFLEDCAFIVIGMLGIKLLISIYTHYFPCSNFTIFIEGNNECLRSRGLTLEMGSQEIAKGDIITSILTISIFIIPLITSLVFNYPKRNLKSINE